MWRLKRILTIACIFNYFVTFCFILFVNSTCYSVSKCKYLRGKCYLFAVRILSEYEISTKSGKMKLLTMIWIEMTFFSLVILRCVYEVRSDFPDFVSWRSAFW